MVREFLGPRGAGLLALLRQPVPLIVVGVVAVGAYWLFFSGDGGATRQGRPPMPVEVITAATDTVNVTLEAVGTTRALEAVVLTVEDSGRIDSINFSEGDLVAVGDLLVSLKADEQQAGMAEAQARAKEAQKALKRVRGLSTGQVVSQARIDEMEAALATAEAAAAAAAARLARYEIRAPFDGRVGLREVSPGSLVNPGDQITTLNTINPIRLRFSVPDLVIGQLKPGLEVVARTRAFKDNAFEGIVKFIDSQVDEDTRSVAIEAELDNAQGLLRPGMLMSVDMIVERHANAVVIPEEAIIMRGANQYVFVVKEGAAHRVAVTLGQRRPGSVEIQEGVNVGDQVVTGGLQKIIHMQPVMAMPAGGPEPMDGLEGDAPAG